MPYDPEPDWFGGSATAQAEAEPDWFGAVAEPVAQAPAPVEPPAAWDTPIAAATDADIPQPEGGPARMPQATLDQWGAEIDQLPLGPERDELAAQYAEAVQQNSQAGFDTRQGAARGLTYEQQLASQGDSFGAAWAEATPVIPKNLALGVASVGKTIGNIASTLTGNREKSDKVNRIWQFGQGLSTAGDRESFMAEHSAPLVAETVGQLSQFIGQAAASNAVAKTAGLGAKGAYALMAAMYGTSTADDSYTHGVDAGLSPVKATAYAGGMGAIEAGLMMLGGKLAAKFGLKTAEELLTPGIKRAAERTVGKYLKDAVLSTFIEGGEEGVTQASQQLWGTALGADSTDDLTQNALRAAMLGAFGNVAASGIDAALTNWPTVVEATKAAETFEGSPPPDTRRGFEKATGQKNTSKVYREAFIDEVGRKNAELNESSDQTQGEPQARPWITDEAEARKSNGWKLHLHTDSAEEVSALLAPLDMRHKVGHSGDQEGKDITVYSGSREGAEAAAKEIDRVAGHLLKPPSDTVAGDDQQITGNVWGRFTAGPRFGEGQGFHQYGAEGVPFLDADMMAVARGTMTRAEARKRALDAIDKSPKLREQFYGKQPAPDSLDASRDNAPTANGPGNLPPPAPGTVRFYHGGEEYKDGKRYVTPHYQYAKDWIANRPEAFVHYVDIPESSPLLRKAYDDTGTDQVADYIHFDAPPEIASQMKPVGSPPAPQPSLSSRVRNDGLRGLPDEEVGKLSEQQKFPAVQRRAEAETRVRELSRSITDEAATEQQPSVAYSGLPLNLTFDVSSIGKAGRRVGKAGKRLLREYFTSAGLANEDISRLNDQRLGKISKHAMQLQQLQSDLNAALNNEFGVVKTLSPELRAKVDAALKGEATDLPASVVRAVEPMRKQVDALSQQFIEAGIGNEDLQATIEENKGVYLTRTYRKHQDKNWAETAKDNPQLMADTKAALKAEYPDDSDSDIEWRINTLLDKDSVDAKGAPDRFKKDAKFQSILMERKNLPEWVRNLYGENRDPWINHTLTVTKMAQLLAHHEFMSDVKDAGMAAGFLSDASEKNPANYRRIDSAGNRLLEPLNGMFTDPDTHKALNDLFSAKSVSPFYRAMTGLSMLTKWNLTVGSFPKGYIRNFLGNPAFALSNGDIGNGDFKKAITLTRDHIFNMGDDASRQYMQRLAELNILDSEVGLSELKAMMGDLADAGDTPQLTPGVLKRGASRVMGAFSKVYQAMDATWKINGFESKKKYYAELHPESSAAEVEQMAADDIKKHYPTYSQVPKGVKLINRTPLYGNFLSFNAEVIRTLKNNLVTINEELRSDNPTANKMGKQRAAGLVASLAMYPAISAASRLMFGVTDDEDDDLRRFQAPWTRNSPFLYTGPLKDGKADTMDLGFMDPRALFTKTVYALMGPGTTREKIEQAFTEITNPLDEDILYGRIISVLRNRTADGRQVYNDSASSEEKMRKSADYLGQVLLPATWSQLERIRKGLNGEISPSGRMYDAATEAVGLVGFRAATVDVRTSLTYRSNDLRRTISDAESGMRQQLLHRGTVPIEETKRVLMDFAQQREKYLQQWHELAQAAIRLGVPENEVRIAVKGATASKKLTQIVMSGEIQPYKPSTETMQEALSRPGGRERADAMRGLLPAPVASPVQ